MSTLVLIPGSRRWSRTTDIIPEVPDRTKVVQTLVGLDANALVAGVGDDAHGQGLILELVESQTVSEGGDGR